MFRQNHALYLWLQLNPDCLFSIFYFFKRRLITIRSSNDMITAVVASSYFFRWLKISIVEIYSIGMFLKDFWSLADTEYQTSPIFLCSLCTHTSTLAILLWTMSNYELTDKPLCRFDPDIHHRQCLLESMYHTVV